VIWLAVIVDAFLYPPSHGYLHHNHNQDQNALEYHEGFKQGRWTFFFLGTYNGIFEFNSFYAANSTSNANR